MLKKSMYDLLFLAHKFLVLFQLVGLTLDIDRGGDDSVGKDLIPLEKVLLEAKTADVFSYRLTMSWWQLV